MSNSNLYPRLVERKLATALEGSPVVLIHGPRQCGKTTLAQMFGTPRGYAYFSLDDDATRSGAMEDPRGFASDLPARAIIDEVQRVPALFPALKLEVDRQRIPGRFLLTGSTQVLLMPQLAESLAGRLQVVRLHPLAQCELARRTPRFLDNLFGTDFTIQRTNRLAHDLSEMVAAGGYPAALAEPTELRRYNWYRNYLDALIQRDVRSLARIDRADALSRLIALAAERTATLFNASALAAPFALSRPTIKSYVLLLERIFLLDRLLPWHNERARRLLKTPKIHIGDTGLACALLGIDALGLAEERSLRGRFLETFAFQELQRQASGHDAPVSFFHFRNKDGAEVDIVLERGRRQVAGVEVKAGATVTAADFRGLRTLRQAAGHRFAGGVVLYDGEVSVNFGDRLYAVPLRQLWQET